MVSPETHGNPSQLVKNTKSVIFSALNWNYLGVEILLVWFEWFVVNFLKSGSINILGDFRKIIFIFVHCVMVYWKHTLNKTIVKIWTSHFTRSENKLCIWPFSKFLGSFYEDLDIWNCPRHILTFENLFSAFHQRQYKKTLYV